MSIKIQEPVTMPENVAKFTKAEGDVLVCLEGSSSEYTSIECLARGDGPDSEQWMVTLMLPADTLVAALKTGTVLYDAAYEVRKLIIVGNIDEDDLIITWIDLNRLVSGKLFNSCYVEFTGTIKCRAILLTTYDVGNRPIYLDEGKNLINFDQLDITILQTYSEVDLYLLCGATVPYIVASKLICNSDLSQLKVLHCDNIVIHDHLHAERVLCDVLHTDPGNSVEVAYLDCHDQLVTGNLACRCLHTRGLVSVTGTMSVNELYGYGSTIQVMTAYLGRGTFASIQAVNLQVYGYLKGAQMICAHLYVTGFILATRWLIAGKIEWSSSFPHHSICWHRETDLFTWTLKDQEAAYADFASIYRDNSDNYAGLLNLTVEPGVLPKFVSGHIAAASLMTPMSCAEVIVQTDKFAQCERKLTLDEL